MYPLIPFRMTLPHISCRRAWRLALTAAMLACPTWARPAAAERDLYAAFQQPAPETRPFVRWWWNGGRVDAEEIVREIDLMHRAGIGGVEINTIAMEAALADPGVERHPAIPWLSPQWVELVRVATEACHQRGMTADIIVGSGWPFGARFLEPEEQTQRVLLAKAVVQGPRTFVTNVRDLARQQAEAEKKKEKGREQTEPTDSRTVFVRLVSGSMFAGEFQPGLDLTGRVAGDGSLSVEVPEGEHILYVGTWQSGYTHVKAGAPGADGPVVNHFDAGAVRHYLEAMSSALNPALTGGMGGALRATFVDSLELDHANWTADLPAEFARRRGYPLFPYLPFILDAPSASPSTFNQVVLRARYDFCRTLVELFEERFIGTYVAWAGANGVKARIQAYGREAHPLHGSMAVSLPEGETWLWMDKTDNRRIRVESTVANKYVASGANLTGQRLRSFEAMTSAVPVFRETLENFKQGMDLTVLSGLNHPILHGFNYSPPDAGYPGWVRFGSYLNEQNPWWPHFSLFADYAARLGTVMRSSDAQAQIAVLAPRPEEWARHGLLYQPFPEVHEPWYQYRMMDALHQAGANADYVSERILEEGTSADGSLRFGPRAYRVIILQDVGAMNPRAAAALVRFVESGGTLVVVGEAPARAPGLAESRERDAEIAAAMQHIEAAARGGRGHLHRIEPPEEDTLLAWTDALLRSADVARDVVFDRPREAVSQVYHRAGERAIYFLANTAVTQPQEIRAAFPGARGSAWLWDPHTGSRTPLALAEKNTLALHFAPLESKLIVFDPAAPAAPGGAAAVAPPSAGEETRLAVTGPWQVEFRVSGSRDVFAQEFPQLVDLSQSEDPRVRDFGGVLLYRTTVAAPTGGGPARLDLGHVNGTTEVRLNGEPLGVRWWGRQVYDLGTRLRAGQNTLEVEVTTTLANQMRSMRDNSMAQRWAWWAPPIEMGLIGPVEVRAAAQAR